MKFLCPRCRAALLAPGGAVNDASHITCPDCGLWVDLGAAETQAGRGGMPAATDLSGERFGDYQLLELLGSGGMGSVYRAEDREGRPLAIKILFAQLAAQPELLERFRREAQALHSLTHPNVVGYRGQGDANGRPFLVLEYVRGRNLENLLGSGFMPVAQALHVARQICSALAAAHAHGIVHRDLKPANVIVDGDNVKVLDFGIAQLSREDLTLTRSDAVLGTFNYMAPEQRVAAKRIDHRADIFSVGVILYRMLTGELPIGSFPPPSRVRPDSPAWLDRVVARALQTRPEDRQASAELLAQALQRPLRTRRWVLAVAATAVVAGLASTALFALWPRGAPDQSDISQVTLPAPNAVQPENDKAATANTAPPQNAPQAVDPIVVEPLKGGQLGTGGRETALRKEPSAGKKPSPKKQKLVPRGESAAPKTQALSSTRAD